MSTPPPPLPPPKPTPASISPTSRTSTPSHLSSHPHRPHHSPNPSQSAAPPPPPPPSLPSPPNPPYTPPILQSYSVADLQYLSNSPHLLQSLFLTTHPTASACDSALTNSLTTNLSTSQSLSSLEAELVNLRQATQQKLLATRELEKRWREREKEMYASLKKFSEGAVGEKLRGEVEERGREARELEVVLVGGEMEGRELGEWVRGYREARKGAALGKEKVGRWEEGRVGGWR